MEALWIILTLTAAAGLGWPVTTTVLKLARGVDAQEDRGERQSAQEPEGEQQPEQEPHAEPGRKDIESSAETPPARPDRAGVLRGGLVIGILERLSVAVAILANEPVAIAYVVAIKGLGRYAELKETPAAAERFIIGTLTSLLWAAAVAALAVKYLL
ncbi:hypothetical protein [Arthrobacter sp. H5]|uniref:hypothetical protein n=1 Tax=Arthrobacter sp. H5 TaxID=1267973 RepID=UPI00048028F3|nr:hypothetical protein [Arthrobacter sp. H5]